MTLFKSIVFILSFGIISCCATKKDNDNISINKSKMMESGFSMATVVASKTEGDCPFTIKMEDGTLFDPINLEDGFKKHDTKIWVKYSGLRMMNRCVKANPVRIDEIQKRVE